MKHHMFKVITRSLLALFIAISFIYLAGCSGSARGGTTACTTTGTDETASGSDCLPGPLPAENLDVEILGIDPPEGPVRTKVTISVKDADKDADTVFLGATEVEATFNDADDTYEFSVPQVAAGSFNIYVKNAGVKSNEAAFTVTETETPAPPAPPPDGDTPDEPASARIVTNSLTDCVYNADCPQELRARGGDTYEWEIEGLPRGMQKQDGDRSGRVNIVGRPTELGNAFKVKVTLRATKDGVAIGGDEKELELTVSQSIAINPYQTQAGADAIQIEKRSNFTSFMVRAHIEMPKQAASSSSPVNKYIVEIPFGEKLELRVIGNAPPEGYIWKIETGKVECDDDQPCDITGSDLSITGSGKTAQVQAAPNFVGKQFRNLKITVADQFGNDAEIVIDKIKFSKDPCTELSIGTDSSGEDFKLGEKLSLEKTATFTVKGGKGPFIWRILKDEGHSNDAIDKTYRLPRDTICPIVNVDQTGLCTTTSRMWAEANLEPATESDGRQRKVLAGAQITEYSYLEHFPDEYYSTYKVIVMDEGCNKPKTATYKVGYRLSEKIEFDGGVDTSEFVSTLTLGAESTDGDSKIDMAFHNNDDEHEVARWLQRIDDLDAIGDEGDCNFGTRCRFHRKKKIVTTDESEIGAIDIRQMEVAHARMFDPGDDAMYLAIHNYTIEAPGWCGTVDKIRDFGGNLLYDDSYWLTCEDGSDCREHFAIQWRTGPKDQPCKQPYRRLNYWERVQNCNQQYATELEQIGRQYTIEVPDNRAGRATAAWTNCLVEASLRDANGQ